MMNQRGMGLVQVLVSVAIMSVVLTGVAIMMTTQMQETKAMTEKLAALDLQKSLINTFAKADVCAFNIVGRAAPFNAAANPIAPINLGNVLYAGTNANTPIVAQVNTLASPVSPAVLVQEIRLNNIVCETAPCGPSSTTFLADVEVVLNPALMVRSVTPPKTRVTLQTTGAGAMKTISACFGEGASAGMRQDTCLEIGDANAGPHCEYNICSCPVGYYMVGAQAGVRSYYGGQYVHTHARIRCCLP